MFRWSPKEQTIYYETTGDTISLLHEVAHAALGHKDYSRDIELLKMERQAWDYTAGTLASAYGISVPNDYIEQMLDTYRDWLHDRSLCPNCEANGIQSDKKQYRCLACGTQWHVNDARTCALRRYQNKK